jgi:hypothetical protein
MRKSWAFLLALFLMMSLFLSTAPPAQAATAQELAAYWAPDFYQDVNATYGYEADFLTRFTYDGDYNGRNNWENLYSYPLPASVYYSVVETTTHYFIGYWTYHPRDDGPTDWDKHENDLEGVLVVVKKDGTAYGQFQLMETFSHNQWYQYTNDPAITSGTDNVDGGVLFRNQHPLVFIQSNGQSPWGGHGVKAYDGSDAPGGDGIVYYYGGVSEVPTQADGNWTHRYSYDLISIDDLWNRRNQIDGNLYADWGVLAGDTYQPNSAKLPWAWDDPDDGPTFTGDVFSDPAHMVDTHLNGLGTFSHDYVSNMYYTHKIQVASVISNANRDPFGGASDIYVKIVADSESVSDDRLWKKNDAPIGSKYYVFWGKNDASLVNQYSADYNYRLVAKKPGTTMSIDIYDSDGTSGDDYMGSLSATLSPGQTQTWTDAYTSNGEARVTATIEAIR